MRYIELGCNVNCWECNEKCSIKDTMENTIRLIKNPLLESNVVFQGKNYVIDFKNAEQFFYFMITQMLKTDAGNLMAQGVSPDILIQEVQEDSIAFYVAYHKMLENF